MYILKYPFFFNYYSDKKVKKNDTRILKLYLLLFLPVCSTKTKIRIY